MLGQMSMFTQHTSNIQLHNKDCLDVLKDTPSNSIDLFVTDCPYRIVSGGASVKYNNQPKGILNRQEKRTKHINLGGMLDDCEQFIAKCSECGQIEDSRMISKYLYCPNCGADMRGSENNRGGVVKECEFCKHQSKLDIEYPCIRCKHNYVNKFEENE